MELPENMAVRAWGMAITKNLVAIMDGTIEVESQEGAGTTFMVDLPFGVSKVDKKTAAEMEEMRVAGCR